MLFRGRVQGKMDAKQEVSLFGVIQKGSWNLS